MFSCIGIKGINLFDWVRDIAFYNFCTEKIIIREDSSDES